MTEADKHLADLLRAARPVDEAFPTGIHSYMRRARRTARTAALLARVSASFAVGVLAWLGLHQSVVMWRAPPDLPMLAGLVHLAAFVVAMLVANALALLSREISRPDLFGRASLRD